MKEAIELLQQVLEDVIELQNNTDDCSLDALNKFYDRMCANATNIEDYLNNL